MRVDNMGTTTLSITTFIITTFSITTFNIMILIMTINKTRHSIMTVSMMTLNA